MREQEKAYILNDERVCPMCGKTFFKAPEHRYKINGKFYCSWTCYRKAQKEGKHEKYRPRG